MGQAELTEAKDAIDVILRVEHGLGRDDALVAALRAILDVLAAQQQEIEELRKSPRDG
jgi:hypothetical protein